MTADSRELKWLPLSSLVPPARPIRQLASERGMEELRRSVKERGVLVPLVVVPRDEQYEVVAGLRRLLAARDAGIPTVPCVVMPADAGTESWAMWVENRLREQVNALDEAVWLERVASAEALTGRELASRLGVSESWVSQRLSILVWPEDVRSAIASGWLSYAVGRELAAIQDERVRRQCLKMARVSGCTARQAADWRRHASLSEEPMGEPGGGVQGEAPGEGPPAVHTACDLCSSVVAEREQRVWVMCPTCNDAALALRDTYRSGTTP
jgi:ParB/RepB/Spo0J family partition protein